MHFIIQSPYHQISIQTRNTNNKQKNTLTSSLHDIVLIAFQTWMQFLYLVPSLNILQSGSLYLHSSILRNFLQDMFSKAF